jgi:C4-dicarboxylate-specific signal transduction histidine kinase
LIDITDRSLAQEKLQQVQGDFAHAARVSMLGELTATIAHEVNQPIAAIRTNGETALRWLDRLEPNIKKARDAIQRILNDAGRASEVVKRIRGMVSGQPPQLVAFDLHEVIGRSLLFLQHEFQSKDVSVSLDLDPALPMVHGDPTQLQQVVVNLAVNAVQALAKSEATQRSIGIRTHQTDHKTVCCIIEDSGPGISPEHLRRLFDSFFTTKETGMGLGLPIVRSIIENHGGHIHADNDSALGGARFIFELPEGEGAVD